MFWFALVVGTALVRGADLSLETARRAQVLLGPGVWSQVIRVENDARPSRYPRELHALVFELAGVLWFYTDTDGTQSFSLRRGRLAEEKADFAPLLRDIEPGFARWSVVPDGEATPGKLPNGCFIDSVAALRARLAVGGEVVRPQLLTYYYPPSQGLAGHSVLIYLAGGKLEVIDPTVPKRRLRLSAGLETNPLELARHLAGLGVANSRLVALDGLASDRAFAAVWREPARATEFSEEYLAAME